MTYRVQARNTAHDSENKIHDDAVARRYGFSGALVPGVDVYAYMMHLPVERWGRAFLERGAAECRFTSPVYDGETVEVTGIEEGDAISIEVNSGGKRCATGSARLSLQEDLSILKKYATAEPPAAAHRPPADSTSLAEGKVLGTQLFDASGGFLKTYLKIIGETDHIYLREGLVHPGNVLRMCNFALFRNVKLGPWIHAGSRVRNLGAGRAGETLSARAIVAANYEKKGHRFVELDVLVLAGARPVAQVLHTAIYQPRQAAAA